MPIIEVRDLEKSYGSLRAVDGVSLSVERGEIFGLLGPNGAGKTTTVECIEGLRSYEGGTISVLGKNPKTEGPELRKLIGMQLQESALQDDIKVWEAMDLYASFYERSIRWKDLLDQLGLGEKTGTRFSKLSGGQKQRLYICLALVNDPKVVFFDELTTGLDPQARHTMWDLVRDVRKRGSTVFLTTHFMEEAEFLCDRVGIIDHGQLVVMGRPEDIVTQQGLDTRIVFLSPAELTEETFRGMSSVTGVKKNDERYEVSGQGEMLVKEVIDRLVERGIRFRNIRTEQPNLEDVFLTLTGRTIRE
jgi:ABC-2 type transport system ATP-binding protein